MLWAVWAAHEPANRSQGRTVGPRGGEQVVLPAPFHGICRKGGCSTRRAAGTSNPAPPAVRSVELVRRPRRRAPYVARKATTVGNEKGCSSGITRAALCCRCGRAHANTSGRADGREGKTEGTWFLAKNHPQDGVLTDEGIGASRGFCVGGTAPSRSMDARLAADIVDNVATKRSAWSAL